MRIMLIDNDESNESELNLYNEEDDQYIDVVFTIFSTLLAIFDKYCLCCAVLF